MPNLSFTDKICSQCGLARILSLLCFSEGTWKKGRTKAKATDLIG